MNTKTLTLSALAIATASFLFSACIREDDPVPTEPTTTEKMVATWKMTFISRDDNGNSILDEGEKRDPGSNYDTRWTFRADSTMHYATKFQGTIADSASGTWSIVGTDYLRYLLPNLDKSVKLHTLDSANLIVEDTSASVPEWTGFVKQ